MMLIIAGPTHEDGEGRRRPWAALPRNLESRGRQDAKRMGEMKRRVAQLQCVSSSNPWRWYVQLGKDYEKERQGSSKHRLRRLDGRQSFPWLHCGRAMSRWCFGGWCKWGGVEGSLERGEGGNGRDQRSEEGQKLAYDCIICIHVFGGAAMQWHKANLYLWFNILDQGYTGYNAMLHWLMGNIHLQNSRSFHIHTHTMNIAIAE